MTSPQERAVVIGFSGEGSANRADFTPEGSDPDTDYGVKSYRGIGKDGKPWEKVMRWFGYQLHLIIDAVYELPVAFEVQPASTAESTRLLPMVADLKERHPELPLLGRFLSPPPSSQPRQLPFGKQTTLIPNPMGSNPHDGHIATPFS